MACLLLARRLCNPTCLKISRSPTLPHKVSLYSQPTRIAAKITNNGFKTHASSYILPLLSLKHLGRKGLSLGLLTPFGFLKRKKPEELSHKDQALAYIPKEVFKKEVVKKPRKRNILTRIFSFFWERIRICWRFFRLSLTFGPLISLYPLACWSESFKKRWWKWMFWACEFSGPTFIKLGQWAGTRRDLFPAEFCDLFSRLHTRVQPHSWWTTRRQLRKAFGKNWMKIFVAVDRKPIGSGCIAQVHKGYMRTDMIPDESVIEDALDEEDPSQEVDFAEGLEIMGFGYVIDSAMGTTDTGDDTLEYEESWRWWRQKGVPLPATKPPKSFVASDQAGMVSEQHPSDRKHPTRGETSKQVSKPGEEEVQLIPVAIKVLHPGVLRSFRRDISILRSLTTFAEFIMPSLRWLSLPECIEEFSELMNRQVNLLYEATALDKFVDNFAENPNIRFPRPIRPFCKRKVLVETFEEGELISNFIDGKEELPHELKETLASYGLDALLQMIFVDNMIHGDLHPGNILVQNADHFNPPEENKLVLVDVCDTVVVNVCPAETPVRLVMLDVGISTSLEEQHLHNFRDVFAAIVIGDGEKVAELMLERASYQKCEDVEGFKRDLGNVVMEARKNTIRLGKIDVSDLFSKVFHILSHHKVKLEGNFASVILAIFVLEGLGRSLDPELDLLERAKPILLS